MKGIIKITDKVRFVYHELEKPNKLKCVSMGEFRRLEYGYNASKREVEVSNINELKAFGRGFAKWSLLINGKSCEADVENGIATILKIL